MDKTVGENEGPAVYVAFWLPVSCIERLNATKTIGENECRHWVFLPSDNLSLDILPRIASNTLLAPHLNP